MRGRNVRMISRSLRRGLNFLHAGGQRSRQIRRMPFLFNSGGFAMTVCKLSLSWRPVWQRWALLGVAMALLPGCSLIPVPGFLRKKPVNAARAKPVQMIGTIALVNAEANFVLVDSGSLPSPLLGSPLESRAADGTVAHLKITEVRKRPFVIADIVDGTPARGDRVFQ